MRGRPDGLRHCRGGGVGGEEPCPAGRELCAGYLSHGACGGGAEPAGLRHRRAEESHDLPAAEEHPRAAGTVSGKTPGRSGASGHCRLPGRGGGTGSHCPPAGGGAGAEGSESAADAAGASDDPGQPGAAGFFREQRPGLLQRRGIPGISAGNSRQRALRGSV